MFKFLSAASLFVIGVVLGVMLGVFTPLGEMLRPSTTISATFVPLVDRVTQLREVTTVRFNYANLVTSERQMPGILNALYGDRQILVAVGHIEAGIDLSEITADDLSFDAETNTLTLNLPSPVIQSCFLNENESYVVSRDTGVFASAVPNMDSEARRFALSQVREQAIADEILEEAAEEADAAITQFVEEFVNLFADEDETVTVDVIVGEPDFNAPLPDTCP